MHVTIIANGFQEEYIYNLLNHLVDKVDRVDFIGSPIYDREKLDKKIFFYNLREDQAEKKSVLSKSFGILNYYRKLFTYLYRTDSKLVHIQWLRFDFLEGVLISGLMRLMGKKVVYTAHNIIPHDKQGTLVRSKFRLIYRAPDDIMVHTSFIKKQIVSQFKISQDKIHVIPHGVYKRRKNDLLTQEDARKQLHLRKDSTVLLFFGIIQAYKGFDTLSKSIELLHDNSNIEILVAGRVSKEYQKEFETLVGTIKGNHYTYLLRYITEEEVEHCFKAADVTVLPYKEASQSGVMFMSYTFGVPVIAPNLGGFPEDVLPQKTGYLFEANNTASLAAAIMDFERDWATAGETERQFIRDFADENYSWDTSCNRLIELYQRNNNDSLARQFKNVDR